MDRGTVCIILFAITIIYCYILSIKALRDQSNCCCLFGHTLFNRVTQFSTRIFYRLSASNKGSLLFGRLEEQSEPKYAV